MRYRKQLALRIYMEKSIEKPDYSYFATLTYDDQNIPVDQGRYCFDKEHITRFLDSLRHKLRRDGFTLRMFGTCEYGDEGYRPHYHFIFYLYRKPDSRKVFKRFEFNERYLSHFWHYGYTQAGVLTIGRVLYACCYALKDDEYLERDWRGFELGRPFRLFSLKPGLGLTDKCFQWWSNYIFNDGEPRNSIRIRKGDGKSLSCGIPTGIKRRLSTLDPYSHELLKEANLRHFEESISELANNAERYGSRRDYTLKDGVSYIDTTPDEDIKAFRKALRRLSKQKKKL